MRKSKPFDKKLRRVTSVTFGETCRCSKHVASGSAPHSDCRYLPNCSAPLCSHHFFKALADGQEPLFVPSKYVVDELQSPKALISRPYVASLCAQEVTNYDGHMAFVDINLPENLGWSKLKGIVTAVVSNASDFSVVLCTNTNSSGMPDRMCNFTYNQTMGPDIHVQVTTSDVDRIRYSLGIEFNSNAQLRPSVYKQRSVDFRSNSHKVTKALVLHSPSDEPYNPILTPIVKLATAGTVSTGGGVFYEFNLCPPEGKYDVSVSVIATDTDSGFGTYLCTTKDCNPSTKLGGDPTGSGLNVVAVGVNAFLPSGSVFVTILGLGGVAVNTFEFGARLTNVD